jgi:hypothetical protein
MARIKIPKFNALESSQGTNICEMKDCVEDNCYTESSTILKGNEELKSGDVNEVQNMNEQGTHYFRKLKKKK